MLQSVAFFWITFFCKIEISHTFGKICKHVKIFKATLNMYKLIKTNNVIRSLFVTEILNVLICKIICKDSPGYVCWTASVWIQGGEF